MICYKGTPDIRKDIQKKQIKHRDFQVLLTTFDYIIKDRPVLSKIKWQYMIMDEGHRLKNTQSKLNIVLRQYYFARYRLILTGTPLQVYHIAYLCDFLCTQFHFFFFFGQLEQLA